MPRSFLVKRSKSDDLDVNPESETRKEIICEASSTLNCQKSSSDSNDSISSKNWHIEYHPTLPQVMPGKGCTGSNHGNAGPCYLCHHGNMIPSHNGCIKYAPIQVPARYNGVCCCMVCQRRSAKISCNCQSCLSLRFEQTAASVLGPSEKSISINPGLCCGRMQCERIEHTKYDFCQCPQCMERISRGSTRFHRHVHPMQRHDTPKIHVPKLHVHVIKHDTKDQNNNESENIETESKNEPHVKESDLSNGHESPEVEGKTDEGYNQTTWTSNLRKRQHEEIEFLINSKVIKTEIPDAEVPCENNGLSEIIRDKEINEDVGVFLVKQSKEDRDIEYTNNGEDNMTDSKDNICVIKSGMNTFPCHENGFDLDDKKQISEEISMDENHNHSRNTPRGRGRRHYHTQLTTTKPDEFETDFEVPETSKWKEDTEVYSDISKSRQRSKLNRLLANEHERRRVAQLNSAYQDLRQLIPGYQCDTKLPKIKILRYAINYIAHLDNILEVDSDK